MSTADHAGRPLRSSTPPRTAPMANAGATSATRGADSAAGRGDGGTLRRDTGARQAADSQATRPVPAGREGGPARTGAAPVQRPVEAGQRPANGVQRPAGRPASARRVRLTVSRVDPWSAMKVSFLLSVALGIAGVIATAVLWTVLDAMGVFDQINGVIGQVVADGSNSFDILDFVGFTRVVSLSIVIGVVDVILMTAIATLAAFLYNISSALVGGLKLTLTDD